MKKRTFKGMLFSAALLISVGEVQAQDNPITFTRDMTFREVYGWANSNATPKVGDFDNDGINDLWLDGRRQSQGWQTRPVFAKGLGGREFLADYEPIMEITYDSTIVQKIDTIWMKDNQGDFVLDGEGNKIIEELAPVLDDEGNPVNDTIVTEHENYMGTKNGLPETAWSAGSQPIDFNADGLVDYLVLHPGEVGDVQGYKLVKNLGNGRFEEVEDETLGSMKFSENPKRGDFNKFNEENAFTSVVTGDYDKDGFVDLLITGMDVNGRFMRLLRNVEGKRFEVQNVFEALPFDKEVNRRGLWEETGVSDNPETGESIKSVYLQDQPTMKAKPLSHGSVAFLDMDNDGWLDIVVTGYADGTDMGDVGAEPGGDEIRFYHNQKDGTFKDVTDQLIPAAQEILAGLGLETKGTLEDVFTAWATENLVMMATDYNQDGLMDLMIFGKSRTGVPETLCLINTPVEGSVFSFYEEKVNIVGMTGCGNSGFFYGDFNGDDVPDVYHRGRSDALKPDGNRWDYCRVFDVSEGGSVGLYTSYGFDYWSNDIFGGFMWQWDDDHPVAGNFGDVDNDGKLDLISSGYEGGTDNFIISYNETDYEPVYPDAPAEVTAEAAEKGQVMVKWPAAYLSNGNVAVHNVYIRNNETGAVRMLVPANTETGKQLAYSMFGAYAVNYSMDEGLCFYMFEKLPAGSYTVGVQAVNYAYLASGFTTAEVTVTDGYEAGIQAPEKQTGVKVAIEGNAITVNSSESAAVAIYNMQGAEVATGMTNTPITVNGRGVFVVKVNHKAVKIVK